MGTTTHSLGELAPRSPALRRPPARASERFAALYDAHFDFVWRVLRRQGIYGAATEDAAQEVWLVAFRRLDSLDPQCSAKSWLYTIARRVAWRLRRTRTRIDRKHRALAVAPARSTPDVGARVEAHEVVEALLERLPSEQRQVFVLSELLSMTGKEIAASIGVKQATVYSRLRLARKRLDTMVAEDAREAAIAALRGEDAPSEVQRQRGWALLLPGLSGAPLAPAPGGSPAPTSWAERLLAGAGAKAALTASAAAAVAGVLLVGAGSRAPVDDTGPSDSAEVARSERDATAIPEPRALAEVTSPESAAAVLSAVAGPIERGPERAAAAARTRAPRADAGQDTPVEAEADAEAAADPLAREAALLQKARRALAAGAPARALELLDHHAATFPRGALMDVQKASRVETLCALGRRAEAAALASEFAAGRPDSVTAQVAAQGCDAAKPR